MSLQRQLLTIICACLSAFFLCKAGFLVLQQFLIIPSTHPLLAQAKEKSDTESTQNQSEKTQSLKYLPQEILLPQNQRRLPIVPGSIENGEWEIARDGITLLTENQGQPIDQNNTGYILYGHNWPVLLGQLKHAKIGDTLELVFENKTQTYQIDSMFEVSPDQLEVLELAKPNTVLLYTCTGFLDSKRLVLLASLR